MSAPEVDPRFIAGLTNIGGLNPFGKSVLRCIWGATQVDEMAVGNHLKYWLANKDAELSHFEFTCPVTGMLLQVEKLEEVPPAVLIPVPKYRQIELGERRFIIEIWRSPQFLAASNRYTEQSVFDNGATTEFFFCRGCGAELPATPQDGPAACARCGSRRHYIQEMREAGEGQLLRTNPVEGCYDFFLRLENGLGDPMAPDEHALKLIEQLWRATKKSRKEKLTDMLAETAQQDAVNRTANSPTNPFSSPAVPGW